MFSYEHLAAFCATVEEGSYSHAARKLNKDRATIREQVKALEDSYAVELFDIQGRKAIVSKTGLELYEQARLLVRTSNMLNTRMLNKHNESVASFDIFHDIIMPNSLILFVESVFAEHFPHIKLNWLHRNRDEAFESIVDGQNQLAFMQRRLTSEVEYPVGFLVLGSADIGVYCRTGHPLLNTPELTINHLQLEKQYVSENHVHTMPELFSVSTDLRLVSNNDVLIELVKKDGWAIISKQLAEPYVKTKELTAIDVKEVSSSIEVGLNFFYPQALKSTPEIQLLIQKLRDSAHLHLK
ncbi:LysR family transcriptional regulator [uncultured Vibrio sp.]|uniref:LysR family transcriptional regulator n=1 Tax=uncultured Vibrio sp. TaxID=114054 RepID=UPI0025FDC021|nr:LysR family transcriptional regulator [uncultured Vibrio sp.]